MPSPPKANGAFISYSHRYADWAGAFHRDLQACLDHHRADITLFFDEEGLRPGEGWATGLEKAIGDSSYFLPILTPEAFASPWIQAEHDAFRGSHPSWHQGFFIPVRLVASPMPPFPAGIQFVDLVDHNANGYRQGLRKVLARLLGSRSSRRLPRLPEDLDLPPVHPRPELPANLRAELVEALAPAFGDVYIGEFSCRRLSLEWHQLEGLPFGECMASAALVLYRGGDAEIASTFRLIEQLVLGHGKAKPALVRPLEACENKITAHVQERQAGTLAATTEETTLLDAYCTNLVESHNRLIDHFHRDQEMQLLDEVFVDLELRHKEVGRQRPAKRSDFGRDSLSQLLTLDPEEESWVTRRWVVLGDPGAGKTTLLRHLTYRIAEDRLRPAADRVWSYVPLFASLARLQRNRRDPLAEAEDALAKAGVEADGLLRLLEGEARAGRLALFLDGLDEVPLADRVGAENLIARFHGRYPATPIVVTSRPVGYRKPLAAAVEAELQPLDRGRRLDFLERWFRERPASGDDPVSDQPPVGDRAARALAVLEADRDLWELSGNPLYLTLMAIIFESGQEPQGNRALLYRQIFEALLEGRYRRPTDEPIAPIQRVNDVRAALTRLAYAMTVDNRDSEPVTETEDRFYDDEALESLRERLFKTHRWRERGMRAFLDDVAEKTGIYGPHDGEHADWKFWHRTFREALAAERLLELWKEDESAVLEQARAVVGDESRWAEPYALLSGSVDDPDALIEALLDTNPDLGLRALATAPRLRPETITRALKLTSDPNERGEVFRALPSRVGDAERALALVDRLRQDTSNGDDLFFLHLAAEELAREGSEVAAPARRLLERFFAHIPQPPPDLFHWIETPRDGRVALWTPIPAGSFRMGSPEGVGDDDERPQHAVTFAEGYALGVVPVTIAQYMVFDPQHEPWDFDVPESDRGGYPVQQVSWYAAVSFCRWLATLPGFAGASLPTEEEWEYACRARTETPYWAGDQEKDLAEIGWYVENAGGRTHRAGGLKANPWGLYDVHGNVFEWCRSRWRSDYASEPEGKTGDPTTGRRVLRGGSWVSDAGWARSAFRSLGGPGDRGSGVGFRVRLPAAPSSEGGA